MLVRPLSSLVCLALLCACSAGGSLPPLAPLPASPAAMGIAVVTVKVGMTINARRALGPQYVGAGVKMMKLAIAGPTVANLTLFVTPTSGGCTTASGVIVCKEQVSLKPGSYTATISTYDSTNPQPAGEIALAQKVPFTVVSGQTSPIRLTLSGIAQSMRIQPESSLSAYAGAGGTLSLYGQGAHRLRVLPYDIDNNLIVGPGAPTISVAQTGGTLGLTVTQPSAPSSSIFALTPSATLSSATATVTVSLSYGSQTKAVCSVAGAYCKAPLTVDMQDLIAVVNSQKNVVLFGANQTKALAAIPAYFVSGTILFDASGDLLVPVCTQSPACTVSKYAPPYTSAPTPVATSTTHASRLAIDPFGNLFVADNTSNLVDEYAPPYTGAAIAQIGDGIDNVSGMAFDDAGDLFVANSLANSVTEYTAPMSGAPSVAATISNVTQPTAVAVNTSGTVFVAVPGQNSAVNVYTGSAPTYTLSSTITNGVYGPASMAFDSSQDLFVSNRGNANVTEYTSYNNPAPSATIATIGLAGQIAIDSANTLFALGNPKAGMIESLAPYSSATSYTSNLTSPFSLAVSP